MTATPSLILPRPGIKRDGTRFDTDSYVDGKWVRWNERGRPQKIGGYDRIANAHVGISRGLHGWEHDQHLHIFSGTSAKLLQLDAHPDGSADPIVDRTPASLVVSDNNIWQFRVMWDAVFGSGVSTIIAHAGQNLNIGSSTQTRVFYEEADGTSTLVDLQLGGSDMLISGGLIDLHPYMGYLDEDGHFIWSVANEPTDVDNAGSGEANITSAKLVSGRRTRSSGGQSPSGIIWSLDKVIRVAFIGGSAVWAFDEIASHSMMSDASIVEVDGQFFWPGVDRFYLYNGVVREIPPGPLLTDFYENLNWDYSGRLHGFNNRRFGEIWWMYPRGESTECNHALIFNYRLGVWYDTALPNSGRSASLPPFSGYRWPIMAGVDADPTSYKLWRHEYGVNEVDGSSINAVQSYFETCDMSLAKSDKPSNASIAIQFIEPDFVQTGDLTLTVKGNANARAPTREGETFTITETAANSDEQALRLSEEHRQLRIRVESNTIDGHYELGAMYVHSAPGSETITE